MGSIHLMHVNLRYTYMAMQVISAGSIKFKLDLAKLPTSY